jgi:hypothetical protein
MRVEVPLSSAGSHPCFCFAAPKPPTGSTVSPSGSLSSLHGQTTLMVPAPAPGATKGSRIAKPLPPPRTSSVSLDLCLLSVSDMTFAAPKSPRRGRKKKEPLVIVQAVVRGHQQRKRFKTEMHRTKVVREFLSSEQVRSPSVL